MEPADPKRRNISYEIRELTDRGVSSIFLKFTIYYQQMPMHETALVHPQQRGPQPFCLRVQVYE